MADPTGYDVVYSFAGYQANNPTTPLPGTSLDNELANVATAIATLVSALTDIRRSDGALKNGIVTFDSFESGLQLTVDPTNGELVAAAVATSAANAALTDADRLASAASAAAAVISAAAAAASAATVNLSLYLPKAGNLANLGSVATARSNLGLGNAATFDVDNGPFTLAQLGADGKLNAYDASHLINILTAEPGSIQFFPCTLAPTGFLKANGALVSRATYPRLYAFAAASNNIVAEAAWAASAGGFSTGDLSTTFRLPKLNGEFIRGWDDGAGVDSGRVIGATQADSLKDHTHLYNAAASTTTAVAAAGHSFADPGGTATATGSPSTGSASETRPRNIPLLACIKY